MHNTWFKFLSISSKIGFFVCLIAVEFLATTSKEMAINEVFWDKFNHFFAFCVLYNLLAFGWNFNFKINSILLLVFGIQIEIVQSFIPNRFFSLNDVIADFIGILIGFLLFKILGKIKWLNQK